MQTTNNNPPGNALIAGLTVSDVEAAVASSGYPLQTKIANLLRRQFQVQDEWTYVDKDTGELRAIDILAQRGLYDLERVGQLRVRPTLDLIIECKQSELPYIFFLADQGTLPDFPAFAGLQSDVITISTDDEASITRFPLLSLLELADDPFIREKPTYCFSFSRAARMG